MEFRQAVGLCALSGILISLSACGGGGDDSSSSSPVSSVIVAGETKALSDYAGETEPMPMESAEAADQAAALAAALPPNMLEAYGTDGLVGDNTYSTMGSSTTLAGVTQTATEQCDPSGSVSGTVNFSSDETLSAGDNEIFTFSNCYIGYDVYLNGQIGSYINAVSGDPYWYPYHFNASAGMVDFSVHMDNASFTMNGGYTYDIDIQSDVKKVGMQGKTFAMSASMYDFNTSTTKNFDFLFTNFNQWSSFSESTGLVIYSNDMTLSSHSLGASVTVDTLVPFEITTYSSAYPYKGKMVITGAQGRSVRVTANVGSVTVDYDLDGDGSFGTEDIDTIEPASRTTTWDQLGNSAA